MSGPGTELGRRAAACAGNKAPRRTEYPYPQVAGTLPLVPAALPGRWAACSEAGAGAGALAPPPRPHPPLPRPPARQVRAKPEEFVRAASRAVLSGHCITCRAVLLLDVQSRRNRRQQDSQLRCHTVTKTYFLHYLPPEGAPRRPRQWGRAAAAVAAGVHVSPGRAAPSGCAGNNAGLLPRADARRRARRHDQSLRQPAARGAVHWLLPRPGAPPAC
jgi:hypothetical protein